MLRRLKKMKNLAWFSCAVAACILLVLAGPVLRSQERNRSELDMVKVAPGNCTVLLDNDRVRVTRVVLKPGEKMAIHRHPFGDIWMPRVNARVRSTPLDGKPVVNEVRANHVYWSDAETHSVENMGKTEYQSVVIELKK